MSKQMSEGLRKRLEETRIKNKRRLDELKKRKTKFGLTAEEYKELHLLQEKFKKNE